MTNSIREIRDADCLFIIGSNTTEAHPVLAMEMKRAALRGAKLIVADPRKIWLSGMADHYLQLKPGTDVALLNGMAHVIIAEGLTDSGFITEHTEGFEAVRAQVRDWTPERASAVCGVPADEIRAAARLYATTHRAGIYYTLGITEHTHGTDNVYGLSNLVLMTGHLGRESSGLNPLRGQNNVQGANDAGASPVFYPGYQRVTDPEAQAHFEAAWGVPLDPDPGLNLNEMMKEIRSGGLRGLFVMGEDILMSEPNVSELEKSMPALEALIVQDIFLTLTAERADVVFPASCFAEKEGTFTNSERRVQRVRKAVEPPGQARADWEILLALTERCGYTGNAGMTPPEIYDEMAGLCDKFAGISYARIEAEGGLQWPCPTSDHPGTTYLHSDGPLRGKAQFIPIDYRRSAELPDPDWPMLLSTGRTLYHYNAATQTRREDGVNDKQQTCFVELHPHDGGTLGVTDQQEVTVQTRRGEIVAAVRLTTRVAPGRIWLPMHFSEARANLLTVDDGDGVTGTAEYKVCAARIVC
ncbi:MAG: molybdopterin-dependent oxidoreductase [Myxococcales bacterium]|nr:molybdopterin-dependent oxidoreductase [Myxococcales bacterium]